MKKIFPAFLTAVPLFLAAVPAAALPEYDTRAWCSGLQKYKEGMWHWECESAEKDCRAALDALPPDAADLTRCVRRYGGIGSSCALLRCVAPDSHAAADALLVIPQLMELMRQANGATGK